MKIELPVGTICVTSHKTMAGANALLVPRDTEIAGIDIAVALGSAQALRDVEEKSPLITTLRMRGLRKAIETNAPTLSDESELLANLFDMFRKSEDYILSTIREGEAPLARYPLKRALFDATPDTGGTDIDEHLRALQDEHMLQGKAEVEITAALRAKIVAKVERLLPIWKNLAILRESLAAIELLNPQPVGGEEFVSTMKTQIAGLVMAFKLTPLLEA